MHNLQNIEKSAEFMKATRGMRPGPVARIVNLYTPGVDWRGCSRGHMARAVTEGKIPSKVVHIFEQRSDFEPIVRVSMPRLPGTGRYAAGRYWNEAFRHDGGGIYATAMGWGSRGSGLRIDVSGDEPVILGYDEKNAPLATAEAIAQVVYQRARVS